jgi:hypothetical protein
MLVIAGGILIAVGALVVVPEIISGAIMAFSICASLAIAAVVWFVLASVVGQTWATVSLIGGFAVCFAWANCEPRAEAASGGESGKPRLSFGRKRS